MGRLDINIEDKLEQRFRIALAKEGKYKRGEIKKKIIEFIEDYLKKEEKK